MKFSEQWLRQFVNPALTIQALTDQMTMIGLSIESFARVAGVFSGVVIGEVLSTQQHPNADKLTCCIVNVGAEKPLEIVCGAQNVRAGLKVAVATVGAVLPGDFKIKEAKLRGELSQGMLCSAKELQLQLGQSLQEGIIELPLDAPIGDDFNAYFKANDHIIDVEITPNRGDCLSLRGVARDMAAANAMSVSVSERERVKASLKNPLPISVLSPSDCPRYVGRVIRNVNNTLETPSFMQHALQRAGVRLINPVVDVCNYVMLELGQPMHAFNVSTLKNKIVVRRANKNETIKLLDEKTITLTSDDLVIADETKVHALAGIMGGLDSSVSADTKDIFLEAAFFEPKTICFSKRRHNTNSDSSYRFERGVDFNVPVEAIERATQLITETLGGIVAELIEIVSTEHLPKREKITLNRDQIHRILGITVSDEHVESILKSLGMSVNKHASGWEVIPPSFRFDMSLPIDLIEELARMTGYNAIPAQMMVAPLTMHAQTEAVLSDKQIRQFFVDRDYAEAMTYSFIEPSVHHLFSPNSETITLKNPLSQDMSVMRASIWPGLLQALQMNLRHQRPRVRLFEMGLCFESDAQPAKLSMAITGSVVSEHWNEKEKSVDFYDLKSDVDALLALSKNANYVWKSEINSALHPGRSSALYRDNKIIGWLGEVHPEILNHFEIRQPVIVCELDLKLIQASKPLCYEHFSKFPMVRRDLALVLQESIQADLVLNTIMQQAGEQLKEAHIFDVYQGPGIETGKKSIALGLTFQDASRTLRDEEINAIIHGVVTALTRELGATLRA